jgi:hypothetical protein
MDKETKDEIQKLNDTIKGLESIIRKVQDSIKSSDKNIELYSSMANKYSTIENPRDINSVPRAGIYPSFSKSDHQHKGMRTIYEETANTPLYGDIKIRGTGGTTVTQSGQVIIINS